MAKKTVPGARMTRTRVKFRPSGCRVPGWCPGTIPNRGFDQTMGRRQDRSDPADVPCFDHKLGAGARTREQLHAWVDSDHNPSAVPHRRKQVRGPLYGYSRAHLLRAEVTIATSFAGQPARP